MMRAIEFGPDGLVEVERPLPEPGAGQVLIEVTASAVCRTDLQIVTGDLPAHKYPVVPGHQVVGRVLGGPRAGQRVGLVWLGWACGHCRFCRAGRENLCLEARFTGYDVDGGWATHVVAHSDFAFELPASPDAGLAPLLCGGVIGYRSLRRAGIGPDSAGQRLGFYGFGASASLAIQVARLWDVECYVVTRSAQEADRARRLGAAWAGTYDQALPVKLDAAITFAPASWVVERALGDLDRGGIVATNAIHLDPIGPINYDRDLWWEREIRSVANVTKTDVTEFLGLAPEITTEYEELPLAQAETALRRLQSGDVRGAFVLIP